MKVSKTEFEGSIELGQSDCLVTTDSTKLEGELPSSAPKLKEK